MLDDDTERPKGPKPEARRAVARHGVLGEGRQTHSPPGPVWESAAISPSGVQGEAPAEINIHFQWSVLKIY